MKKKNIIFIVVYFISTSLFAQTTHPPFWEEIQSFKKADSLHFPGKNKILFVGSSSFAKWTDVQNYFPGYKIINRGFGGSSLPDVIRYTNDVIIPYHPKQVVIYCGDNDLAASNTVAAVMVANRFKQLFSLIRNKLPDATITYVAIKPSPSRQHLMHKMETANNMIKTFLSKKRNTGFVDVYHKMLDKKGDPMADIFLEDKLHMNAKGYAIWQKAIKPYLIK
jgi:lysophospholipase L1-like esterase